MKKILSLLILATLSTVVFAQDKAVMGRYEDQLNALIERVQNAPTDNERYLANEQAVQTLTEALKEEDSQKWNWKFSNYVSVLRSPDKVFTIITWPVVKDNGEYECFGFVQSKGEDSDGDE